MKGVEGHNVTFVKEKSNIFANLSKNDLLKFEGKNEKFLEIQEISGFCDCIFRFKLPKIHKFKQILKKIGFPTTNY